MDSLERVKQHHDAVGNWFGEKVAPLASGAYPSEHRAWQSELNWIRRQIDNPERTRIALVGSTGAGKSSFLNAVLGQEVLPVGVMQPCTAFVTLVRQSPDSTYTLHIEFCTRDEWLEEIEAYAALLQPGDDAEVQDDADARRLIETTFKRLQAVLGDHVTRDMSVDAVRSVPLPTEAEDVFSGRRPSLLRFDDGPSMQKELRALIRGDSNLWPLVKQVSISGPYDCLSGGLELVDLPGVNDPNAARVEVTREFLRSSPFVWVIFSMVRGLTHDIQMLLGEQKLLRTLVLAGTYDALGLIGTKADEIDLDAADQLGLPDDCEQDALIREYCRQTQVQVRTQLESLVRDLAGPEDGGETLNRMLELARQAPVHTTSASAYMRLRNIGRLRKDYGLHDVRDTGIPGIHDLMRKIAKQTGIDQRSLTAMQRLRKLVEEIKFFFQSAARQNTPVADEVTALIDDELRRFQTALEREQSNAQAQLQAYRDGFVRQLLPMLDTSIHGVKQACRRWAGIPWQTLRAVVHRDGLYKSPSSGRSYDLNADLTEPLLNQLPLTWERYFTDDIGRVTSRYAQEVVRLGRECADRVELVIKLKLGRNGAGSTKQLAWFTEKMQLLAGQAQSDLKAVVMGRRSELATKMPNVACGYMAPAYESAKHESGRGMKVRMLDTLSRTAVSAAPPIFESIQADILEGTEELDVQLVGLLSSLATAAGQQIEVVKHNAGVDVDEASIPAEFRALIESAPAMP